MARISLLQTTVRSRPVVRAVSIAALTLTLAACTNWFGGDGEPALPGERITVLKRDDSLKASGGPVDVRLPAPQPNSAWPQPGGYSHHAMEHMDVGAVPQRLWSVSAGRGTDSRNRLMADPVVADGRVYVIDTAATVSAFDADTGDRLWEVDLAPDFEEDDSVLGGGVAFDGGRLFVTTGFAKVFALDAATGKTIWEQSVTAPMRAGPTVQGGRLFLTSVDNKGFALATSDGRILWTHSAFEETASLLVGAEPAVDNGVALMPYTTGEIAALRVDTGAELWSDVIAAARRTDAIGNISDIGARPVIDGHRVFVIGHGGLLVGIDMRSGDRVWEREMVGLNQPWAAGGTLFVVTAQAEVVAVEASSGRILWVTALPQWEDEQDRSGQITWGGPTLASNRLIVTGSHGEALTLSPYDGKILGRMDLPSGITLSPALANGTLYFLTDDADLVAYR